MAYENLKGKLETISGICITPFNKDTKEIDWAGVEENIEFLLENGVEVIVPCGNTSEFYSLTIEEAKQEINKVVEIVNGRATVIAGVGYSVETAIDLGTYAREAGADGIMVHMPIHPYITERGASAYFKAVIEGVDLPAIVYFKDPNLSDHVLLELAPLHKLVGVKYAINDLPRFAKLLHDVPKEHHIVWICGTAEKWAPFFYMAGAKGFTSGLVNVHPQKSFEMLTALQNMDDAAVWKVWNEILLFEDLRAKYNSGNNVVVVKEAMNLLGFSAGVTREPVAPLNKEDKQAVAGLIEAWGLRSQLKSV
ncbi:dihydrodipicolinate synthase family protein [Jeotgalibacillus soli]|uniref:Dihydrodipicolinate synthase n=1 Tax=Jeotgalibacillus soli TaxID=889306 RepID=A0A0C2W6D0_9BACL|nr:dihydrodipicolinate synthase family protein [Jeotgalibacillus soli]KIL52131.1 dihydrodipicolinate synthase [Jeotgalibacillus soli]